MERKELKALFVIDSLGDKIPREKVMKLIDKDVINQLFRRDLIQTVFSEKKNWLVLNEKGHKIVFTIASLTDVL